MAIRFGGHFGCTGVVHGTMFLSCERLILFFCHYEGNSLLEFVFVDDD